ncbi:winged helix-turn-helix domain-containing protein [Kitasatospora sp. NPDC017646]|uniref:winged helix-turn-helix domain-containing protein n=1 Tax=Kitasatospora sp. NPDC017646 TaxID=3364024 RepID=UPI003795458E
MRGRRAFLNLKRKGAKDRLLPRLRAVAALVEGRDREDVAAMFKVSLKAVDGWWAKWLVGGPGRARSASARRQAGEHQALSEAEQAAVRQAVLDHQPCDLGLRGQLWTRGQIGALIASLYRVHLTEPGVDKYLRRWGCRFSGRTSARSRLSF